MRLNDDLFTIYGRIFLSQHMHDSFWKYAHNLNYSEKYIYKTLFNLHLFLALFEHIFILHPSIKY